MIAILQAHSAEVVTLISVPLGIILTYLLRPRAKLVRSVRHASTLVVEEPLRADDGSIVRSNQVIHTASVSVTNLGREPAISVEIVFNWKPQFINVWPSRIYAATDLPDGRWAIELANLAPKETFGMEIISINVGLPGVNTVRSNECEAVELSLQPQQIQPRWRIQLAAWLMLVGLIGSVFYLIKLIQFIAAGAVN
jgi:hypothetical protein